MHTYMYVTHACVLHRPACMHIHTHIHIPTCVCVCYMLYVIVICYMSYVMYLYVHVTRRRQASGGIFKPRASTSPNSNAA